MSAHVNRVVWNKDSIQPKCEGNQYFWPQKKKHIIYYKKECAINWIFKEIEHELNCAIYWISILSTQTTKITRNDVIFFINSKK